MAKAVFLATALVLLIGTACQSQSWYWAYDGTSDFICTPTSEGSNPLWLRPTDIPSYANGIYWEITDNALGGRALRIVDQSTSRMLRWQGAGSRPEHYRGVCNAYAHDNFRSDHNAVTVTMRFKVEDFIKASEDTRRFFNFEFETTVPKPSPTTDHTTYEFRFEPTGCWKDTSGNLWLRDLRSGETFVILKPAAGQPKWIKLWATMKLPNQPYVDNNCIYDMWIDQEDGQGWKSYAWQDRDKGGWSDVELGSLGDGEKGNVNIDYLCWTYGAYAPGTIPIPAESNPNNPPNPFPGFDKNKIAHIRTQPDGYAVELSDKVVTGVFTDPVSGLKFYYVEELDRTVGIKVSHPTGKSPVTAGGTPVALAVGDRVYVLGGLSSASCERQVVAHYIQRLSTGGDTPDPVGLTNRDLRRSLNSALVSHAAPQNLYAPEMGSITGLATTILPWIVNPAQTAVVCSRVTDASKNWTPNQWRGKTLTIPAQGSHGDLYYYIVANTQNTLTLTMPSFLVSLNIAAAPHNVAVGQTYLLPGTRDVAMRVDGMRVTAWGRVSSVDVTGRTFYIDDGTNNKDCKTLQDIMIPYNAATDSVIYSLYYPPDGIRVRLESGTMPNNGDYVSVTGCAGVYQHRFTISATVGGSVRDPKLSPAPNSENAIQLAYILAAERGQDDFTLDRWLDHVWKGRRNGRQRGKSM